MDYGGKRNPDGQGFAVFGRVIHGKDVVAAISGFTDWPAGLLRHRDAGAADPSPEGAQTVAEVSRQHDRRLSPHAATLEGGAQRFSDPTIELVEAVASP